MYICQVFCISTLVLIVTLLDRRVLPDIFYCYMAIKIHLGRLLGERKMKMAELSRKTGISKNALSNLYYEEVKAIRFDTLEKICNALGCTVGELIEYQPDN